MPTLDVGTPIRRREDRPPVGRGASARASGGGRIFSAIAALALGCSLGLGASTAAAQASGPEWFAPSSIWSAALPATARTDGSTRAALSTNVARLVRQIGYRGRVPGINTTSHSTPVYVIPSGETNFRKVTLVNSGGTSPQALTGNKGLLQQAWLKVPIPVGVSKIQPDGYDGYVAIYRPETDELWDFYRFANRSRFGWSAAFGSYTATASARLGVASNHWGARASGLTLPGGLISLRDASAGSIDHALAFGVYSNCGHIAPATRGDCFGVASDHLPLGVRFRLPPTFDVNKRLASAPPLTRMIALAAKRYGIVLVDHVGGSVGLFGEDPRTIGTRYTSTTTNPWPRYIGNDWGQKIMYAFPWKDLQQVLP